MSAATDMERHMRIRNQATTKRLGRSRWAAIGAAVAVSMGAGGIGMIRAADNPERASLFVPIAPCRLADTRAASTVGPIGEPIGATSTLTFTGAGLVGECDLSPNATALSLNITSVGATAESFYTAWPAGENMPTASHLNPKPGQRVTGSGVDVSLSETGKFNLYNNAGTSDVVIDVLGVYVPGALGAEGAAGAPGAPGEPGQDGSDGAAGPQGEQGPAGPQGEIGPFGPAGPQGDAGTDGVDGTSGVDGIDGEDGADGQNGVDGQDGDTGPQGPAGQNGTDGEDGSDGQNGTNGQDGSDGAQGSQGEQGTQGEQGSAGQNGTNGENGTDGQDGQQGPQGEQGPQGPAGPEKTLWWIDADGDDYGSNDDFTLALTQPTGFVANNDDCRDDNAAVNPDAVEIPDNRIQGQFLDDDCDGVAFITFYADSDGDRFVDPDATIAADASQPPPNGYRFFDEDDDTDCDDTDGTIYPGAQEIADDGIDQNCDGSDATVWYYDGDGDDYGVTGDTRVSETPYSAYRASQGGDCNDNNSGINPGETEIDGNTVDENCDGDAPYTFFQDGDLDDYTTTDTLVANWLIGTPNGYRNSQSNPLDCDDTDGMTYPGATEIADDGIDQDCDGSDARSWHYDGDGDGYGRIPVGYVGEQPPTSDFILISGDCQDQDFGVFLSNGNEVFFSGDEINPAAAEIDGNPVDDNCDGDAPYTFFQDDDGDYSTTTDSTVANWIDGTPTGYRDSVSNPLDCDDTDASIRPTTIFSQGGTEIADDGIDQNCDGSDLVTWYRDADNDGWTLPSPTTTSNTEPNGYSAPNPLDCNDANAAINPGATEVVGNTASAGYNSETVDENCDGEVQYTFYRDNDGDGFHTDDSIVANWLAGIPVGYVAYYNVPDCDDTDPLNEALPEIANVFSPDGDGVDDTVGFEVPCLGEEFLIFVYNRWGEVVFETNDQTDKWDGTHQSDGSPLNADVYVYLMTYKHYGWVSSESTNGNINLVR